MRVALLATLAYGQLSRRSVCKEEKEKDPRALDDMSPMQEICNALSMLAPLLAACCLWCSPPWPDFWNWRTAIVVLAITVHLPFSFSYHILLSQRMLHDAICNVPRKLDQSCIHLACALCAWALSTSTTYTSACTLMNVYFMYRLWAANGAGTMERMVNIGLATLAYGLPGLYRQDYFNFCCGVACFCVGASAMVARLGGWGHCIMHLALGGMMHYVLMSAAGLQ
jgi:hypothetical protein